MSGNWFGVPEPEGNDFQGNASLKEAHCAGMSKGVAGDPSAAKGRALDGGLADGQRQTKSDTIATQGCSGTAAKDRVLRCQTIGFAPLPQQSVGPGPHWDRTLLAALTVQAELHPIPKQKPNVSLRSRIHSIPGEVGASRSLTMGGRGGSGGSITRPAVERGANCGRPGRT
jgi:hypothetical protein